MKKNILFRVKSSELNSKSYGSNLWHEKKINIYGNDYATKDGTGVRDYVHVNDLAKAHLSSIDYVLKIKQA